MRDKSCCIIILTALIFFWILYTLTFYGSGITILDVYTNSSCRLENIIRSTNNTEGKLLIWVKNDDLDEMFELQASNQPDQYDRALKYFYSINQTKPCVSLTSKTFATKLFFNEPYSFFFMKQGVPLLIFIFIIIVYTCFFYFCCCRDNQINQIDQIDIEDGIQIHPHPPIIDLPQSLEEETQSSNESSRSDLEECFFCMKNLNPEKHDLLQSPCPSKITMHAKCQLKWLSVNDSCPCGCGTMIIDDLQNPEASEASEDEEYDIPPEDPDDFNQSDDNYSINSDDSLIGMSTINSMRES